MQDTPRVARAGAREAHRSCRRLICPAGAVGSLEHEIYTEKKIVGTRDERRGSRYTRADGIHQRGGTKLSGALRISLFPGITCFRHCTSVVLECHHFQSVGPTGRSGGAAIIERPLSRYQVRHYCACRVDGYHVSKICGIAVSYLLTAPSRSLSAAPIFSAIASALSASSCHLPISADSRLSCTRRRASKPRHLSFCFVCPPMRQRECICCMYLHGHDRTLTCTSASRKRGTKKYT